MDGDFKNINELTFWMNLLFLRPEIKAYGYSKSWKEFLIYEGIETIWSNLQSSSPTEDHFIQQVHRWFDGLKTIRLLKYFTKIA